MNEEKNMVDCFYEEIVFWKQKNLFNPPRCEETKEMIREMANWIIEYVQDGSKAKYAIKWLMILPTLLLQKQQKNSKPKDNIKCLKRRVKYMRDRELEKLITEAFTLRKRHERDHISISKIEDGALTFKRLMEQGRVNPSLRILSEKGCKGTLELNADTRDELKKLHPQAESACQETKLQENPETSADYLFEAIDGETIWKKAIRTEGSAGPSGLNAKHLKSLLN